MPLTPLRLFPFDRTGQPDHDPFYPSNSNFFKIARTIFGVTVFFFYSIMHYYYYYYYYYYLFIYLFFFGGGGICFLLTYVLLFYLLLEIVLEKFPANEDQGESEESVWKAICKKIDTKCRGRKYFHTKLKTPPSPTPP